MDVCILAGGKGTRLAGVWDGPKCLVPVGGRSILAHLISKSIVEVRPKNIVISIGSQTKGLEVIQWWCKERPPGMPWDSINEDILSINFAMEPAPIGRLRALISCLPALTPPILVLNGDTLPRYDLRMLGTVAGMARLETYPTFAGAFVMDAITVRHLHHYYSNTTHYELEDVIDVLIERRVYVPGFLDVGTPAGFAEAQQLAAAEG